MTTRVESHEEAVQRLQKQLSEQEERLKPLNQSGARHGPEWDAICKSCASVRTQLFDLTGDYYGKPKVKLVRPDDDLLNAAYDTPDEVPKEVMDWVRKTSIITGDATDAVRWARIVGTENHDRYPEGDVQIYRAITTGSDIVEDIRPGDWVTTELAYAESHLKRCLGGRGQIIEATVDGRDILTSPTGDAEEAIFAPLELSAAYQAPTASKRKVRPR